MEQKHYYHMFANGDDARNFITSEKEFKTAFNRIGVCQHLTNVTVVCFSIEDSHPHSLLYGTLEQCTKFKLLFESLSKRCIVQQRQSSDGVNLHCELYPVEDDNYLMNVAIYVITQATKDGKAVMPYDYLYGTGALYFRSKNAILPWQIDNLGNWVQAIELGSLTKKEQHKLCGTKHPMPQDWKICNGFILPNNYVDIKQFENIFRTHNCFRAFLASGKTKDTEILLKMSDIRGVTVDDLQARELCHKLCRDKYQRETTRMLSTTERISVALELRKQYRLSFRQLATLVRIPENEIRKYMR